MNNLQKIAERINRQIEENQMKVLDKSFIFNTNPKAIDLGHKIANKRFSARRAEGIRQPDLNNIKISDQHKADERDIEGAIGELCALEYLRNVLGLKIDASQLNNFDLNTVESGNDLGDLTIIGENRTYNIDVKTSTKIISQLVVPKKNKNIDIYMKIILIGSDYSKYYVQGFATPQMIFKKENVNNNLTTPAYALSEINLEKNLNKLL